MKDRGCRIKLQCMIWGDGRGVPSLHQVPKVMDDSKEYGRKRVNLHYSRPSRLQACGQPSFVRTLTSPSPLEAEQWAATGKIAEARASGGEDGVHTLGVVVRVTFSRLACKTSNMCE